MEQPTARELLTSHLLKRQQDVLHRLRVLVTRSSNLAEIHDIVSTPAGRQYFAALLKLLILNVANPHDRRCFTFARRRAGEHFQQGVPVTQLLRMAALHRHIVTKMVRRQFKADAGLMHQMLGIIDGQVRELEVSLVDTYHNERDREWRDSETKYYSLLENASEAIVAFRPGEGRILEANMQAERLLGRPRAGLIGVSFVDLFPPEHREQVRWLVQQGSGMAGVRLEDLSVLRTGVCTGAPTGIAASPLVPVALSCNWIAVDGNLIAQVIMRDVTQLRQVQRELQNYAEQLEQRVAERTQELQQSEERYRDLFLQERRRARHLSLINEVQKCALASKAPAPRASDTFIYQVTSAIHSHFRDCDVAFYWCEAAYENHSLDDGVARGDGPFQGGEYCPLNHCGDLILIARTRAHGLTGQVGDRHPYGVGLPGHAMQEAQTLFVADNAAADERYQRAPGVERDPHAQLCVPMFMEGVPGGVLCLQSEAAGTLEARDAAALQTVAGIITAHLASARLFGEMRELNEFNQTLITTMLNSLMVVDREGVVRIVNERLCQTLRRERDELVGLSVASVFGESLLEQHQLMNVLRDVTETGTSQELQEIQMVTAEGMFVFDLRIFRVYFRGAAQAVVLMINVTRRWRNTFQLQLMNQIGRLFQACALDIDRVLHTVLTCITAGSALGFNRAFLLLRDSENQETTNALRGVMALGPSSAEEAGQIWSEFSQHPMNLLDILAQTDRMDAAHPTPLQQQTLELSLHLDNPCFPALTSAMQGFASRVRREELVKPCAPGEEPSGAAPELAARHRAECEKISRLFTASEIAIAPLVGKDRIVGVVLADNLYSGTPIEDDDVRMLENLAQQAGLTIFNALTFRTLQQAQKELISAERLVAVGEMAARVSHEIRNPLATIGGFARNILKRPEATANVIGKTSIIIEEVARLEELLADLLDMARPRQLDLQAHVINDITDRALLLADADIKAQGVLVEKYYDPDLPPALVDRSRLLQALLNTVRNGAQAMPEGGTLTITTRVRAAANASDNSAEMVEIEIKDTGVGISQRALKQVFDPFFSTKIRGSGLGLAVTRRILEDHGGDIDVYSQEGQGTAFILALPLRRPLSNGV
ncbi:MAG TPA: ATP-binding protein [Abditibacteriaceae bacterium]|nr:ATP-binding protein [Abditibacteriaceae bacterium]